MRRAVILVALLVPLLGAGAWARPLAASAATAVDVERPFEFDPLAPYRQLTSSWAPSTWTVYACGPDSAFRVDLDAVVADFTARATSLFEEASGGLFAPRFRNGGTLPNPSTCDSDAKGEAVILLRYSKTRPAWGFYRGEAPEVSLRNGRIVHSGRRVITIYFSSAPDDPIRVGSVPIAHEIGHTLGWAHLPIDEPGALPYGNITNVMSGGHNVAAWYRYVAGWTEATVHTTSRTYQLGLPRPGAPGLVAVPTGEVGKLFTVSVGPDGVEVHRVDFSAGSTLGHCGELKRKGMPLCFANGTEVKAVAPPAPRNATGYEADYRKVGWEAPSTIRLPAAGVTVHVESLRRSPDGEVEGAEVRISGRAQQLWPRDWTPPAIPDGTDGTDSGIDSNRSGTDPDRGGTDRSRGVFADTVGHLFEVDISALADAGITRGCNPPANTRFCPDDYVTRGQMAAFFVRALGLPRPRPQARFSDMGGHLFEADVAALAAAGITRGCNPPANDRFCPDEPITRGQMAAFLVRAFDLPPLKSQSGFGDTAGHVFEADAASLAQAGVTRGCNPPANDRFCPDEPVTRGQMAAFLMRALADR